MPKLPDGCYLFGSGITDDSIRKIIETYSNGGRSIYSLLILAGSKTAEVEGISWAGATAKARRYTALADAELLIKGPSSDRKWSLPPLPAGVSPALISHVASKLIDLDTNVINVGLKQVSQSEYFSIEHPPQGPALCLSSGKSMSLERVEALWNKGFEIGHQLDKPILISECVPGGTTTAQAVLTGLGLEVGKLINGSVLNPPFQLKKNLIEKGLKQASLGLNPSPKKLLAAIGDPFQPLAVGLILGARSAGQEVLLGGGAQMLAVLALAIRHEIKSARLKFVEGILLSTTSWLFNEKINSSICDSSIAQLMAKIEKLFDVSLLGVSSGLNFKSSYSKALRDYELGYIREGVGAGAISFLAELSGISCYKLVDHCEKAVIALTLNNNLNIKE
tara:strand:- start:4773 stop:5948 length:1176 start_codon:yes stop_codon:yes gene_type:complete